MHATMTGAAISKQIVGHDSRRLIIVIDAAFTILLWLFVVSISARGQSKLFPVGIARLVFSAGRDSFVVLAILLGVSLTLLAAGI
jgi:hypothetical protein